MALMWVAFDFSINKNHFSWEFLALLRQPERLALANAVQQEQWLRLLRRSGLLAWMAASWRESGALVRLPSRLRDPLLAAEKVALEHERRVRWELDRIRRALFEERVTVVPLKGAAYYLAGLAMAQGRLVSDVDLLVARADLDRVEESLLRNGWRSAITDPYDQSYYRQWMHELPPLRHPDRLLDVDLHHNLVPVISGWVRPDPAIILASARILPQADGWRIPAPQDLVLHAVLHLFQDGDPTDSLRDLVDLDGLLREFGGEALFWSLLLERAEQWRALRSLYYALRFTRGCLQTPVPDEVWQQVVHRAAPVPLIGMIMDWAVTRAIFPETADWQVPGRVPASWLLYLRSHGLRLPPGLLLRHLWRKGWRRTRNKGSTESQA